MKCNICNSDEFTTGPNGRLSYITKIFPQCIRCGSLERHRAIRKGWEKLLTPEFNEYSVLQFSNDPPIDSNWFGVFEKSVYGEVNSIDLEAIDRPNDSYDIVILNHVLEHVRDDYKAVKELLRIVRPEGFIQMTVPLPQYMKKTDDWGYQDSKNHGHYRTYGEEFIDRFNKTSPANWHKHIEIDDVSLRIEWMYFISKSLATINQIQINLTGRDNNM